MVRRMTLGGRLAAMLAILSMLALMIALAGIGGVVRANNRQHESAVDEDASVEMTELARAAQLHFLLQVQEWKNVLLRSDDEALVQNHRASFLEHERLTFERLAALEERMREGGLDTGEAARLPARLRALSTRYREAVKHLDRAVSESDKAVDARVRGMDREAGIALDQLSLSLQARAAAKRRAHRDAAEALVASTWWKVLASLAMWLALGAMMAVLIIKSITVPADQAVAVSKRLAEGDLGVRVDEPGTDELGQMLGSLGRMSSDLRKTIGETRACAGTLTATADEILGAARRTVQSTQQQATAVQQTTTSTAELAETVRVTEERAGEVQRAMDRTLETSRGLRDELGQTQDVLGVTREELHAIVESIRTLVARNEQIGEIIDNVREVADQTQLLAVNAGIEAVKAGELGRGFGVVAAEMKALADQSKRSAQRIRGIVGEVQRGTADVVAIVDSGRERVEEVLRPVGEMVPRIGQLASQVDESAASLKQILAIVQQQTVGIDQINQAMKVVQGAVQETLAQNQQLDASAEQLRGQARQLDDSVAAYRF